MEKVLIELSEYENNMIETFAEEENKKKQIIVHELLDYALRMKWQENFEKELEKGNKDIETRRVEPALNVFEEMKKYRQNID